VSSGFSSKGSGPSAAGFAVAAALALIFWGTGCLKAHIFSTDAGSSGGAGGAASGTGGVAGQGPGIGGESGVGGDTGLGGAGDGGTGAGQGGSAGSGTGGTISGTGGSEPDAGYDGPIAPTPDMAGQLVITEIMADTNAAPDESGEWFEVYNPSASDTFDVFGCFLSDSGNTDQVTKHLLIGPGDFLTFARFGTAAAGGFMPSFDYHTTIDPITGLLDPTKDVKFSNGGDLARNTCGASVVIDVVVFAVVPNGRSLNLDPSHFSATDNDLPENWCPSPATAYHTTTVSDYGTPGTTNPPCPRG
jgi:hypothetical protein